MEKHFQRLFEYDRRFFYISLFLISTVPFFYGWNVPESESASAVDRLGSIKYIIGLIWAPLFETFFFNFFRAG